MNITKEKLIQIYPNAAKNKQIDILASTMNYELAQTDINTKNRVAGFIAQCGHESGSFTTFVENLNYSAKGLRATFPKYFPDDATAVAYERNPVKIGSRVYANRMGNGDEASGEGYLYRGRGLIQLTGHDNYKKCGAALGANLLSNPSGLETAEGAIRSAIWFWTINNINKFCDADDIINMTKRINGGTIGLDERMRHYEVAKSVL